MILIHTKVYFSVHSTAYGSMAIPFMVIIMFMPLAKTSSENKHTHLVYLSENLGQGLTSVKGAHTHELIFDPDQGVWVMSPGDDGHVHELVEYTPRTVKAEKKSDEDKVDEVHSLFRAAMNAEGKARKDAKESEDFYKGEQWDKTTVSTLQSEKRTAITINEVAAKIDLLSGFQRQNRTDTRFAPIEDGDSGVARILDVVYKNIEDQNGYDHEETLVFRDQTVTGRGIFHVYMDFDEDVQGKIVIERLNWKQAYFGPHEKFDLSDCEHFTKSKMFSVAQVKQMWPEKKSSVEAMMERVELGTAQDPILDTPDDQYRSAVEITDGKSTESLLDIESKEIRVFENYHKQYYTEYSVVINEQGEVYQVRGMSKREADEWETIPVVRTLRRTKSEVIHRVVAGSVFLEEKEPLESFPVVPAYAKKIDGYFYGKVEEIKDPQREINKRHSQAIDILNKQATYSWMYDGNTFESPNDEREFLANSSTPGYAIKVSDMQRQSLQKLDGVRMPTEVVGLMQLSSQKLQEIMNIPIEAQGLTDREFSGIALQEKRRSTQVANEFLFDNLNTSKRHLAKKVIALVQEHYTVERILRLVNNSRPLDEGDQQKNQINMAEAAQLLQNNDLMQYDVVTTPSVKSPTMRSANFAILVELAKQGFPIPPGVIIKSSDLPNKDEILGQLAEQAQASQQAEQQKTQVELIKSLPDELQAQALGAGQAQPEAPNG